MGGLDSRRQPRGEQRNPGWAWVLVGLFHHGPSTFLFGPRSYLTMKASSEQVDSLEKVLRMLTDRAVLLLIVEHSMPRGSRS